MGAGKILLLSLVLLSPTLPLSGGEPDEAGYRWIDSDAPGGPDFNWVEISSLGTQIQMGDDDNAGPFPLGLDFTYYGTQYDSLRICSNGWLSFTSRSHQFHHLPIPSPGEPNALLAPFWFDLDPSAGGRIYYYPNTMVGQFVAAWYAVPPYGGSGGYTFQTILNRDGTVLFQYKRMQSSAGVESTSVGIEDGAGVIGLQYFYNGVPAQNLLHDSLAIEFYQLEHDVMPVQVHSPLDRIFPTVEVAPRLTVKNYGKSEETFTVQCQISDSATGEVAYEDSETVAGLVSLGEAFVEFPSTWSPGVGTYEVNLVTLLLVDEDPSNDTLTQYTTCSYRAEMAYDDGEADNFRYIGGSPDVHWALAVRFTPPFSSYRILGGRVLVEDTSPFEEVLICPDVAGRPAVNDPYGREEWVSAPSPYGWACVSLDTVVESSDDIWLVAVWPLAASSPRVGEDADPPIDNRSWYGVPGVYWNPWAAGDWIMRIEIDGVVGIEEMQEARSQIQDTRLMQNYPNPFTRTTTISYRVSADGGPRTAVSLGVYDLSGRLVRTLVNNEPTTPSSPDGPSEPRGNDQIPMTVVWDGRDEGGREASSGVYFYRLEDGRYSTSRKMVLLR